VCICFLSGCRFSVYVLFIATGNFAVQRLQQLLNLWFEYSVLGTVLPPGVDSEGEQDAQHNGQRLAHQAEQAGVFARFGLYRASIPDGLPQWEQIESTGVCRV